ncbi:hypothetical protein [uncultured phage cr52_1]|uniref:Uncharacterized protein n=1 Tax=uncultured phage cr52_1 TaxID=2772079 RepID=A0A7M1RQD9_9CAUD|nr:virion structural protein [uncultured phage cr52_1]QOR56647.1 hypothetical protein [uncultured phage cr52_1]
MWRIPLEVYQSMKLNTLSSIIDDILLELRNSSVAESEHISRILIEQWIANYRAVLIKQDIDKGRDINPMYILTMPCIHLDKVDTVAGKIEYKSNIELPKLIDFHFRTGLVYVKDMYGNLIQLGHETKMRYQRYRKYTCGDYIAYIKNNRLYIEGSDNQLEWVEIGIIAENPADLNECFDPDSEYPVPAHMIPVIKDMIFSKELNIMHQMPSDETNNSRDDMLNINVRLQ